MRGCWCIVGEGRIRLGRPGVGGGAHAPSSSRAAMPQHECPWMEGLLSIGEVNPLVYLVWKEMEHNGLPLCAMSLATSLMAVGLLGKDWSRGMGGLGLKCSEDGCKRINFGYGMMLRRDFVGR